MGDLSGKVVFVGYSDLYEPDQPDRFYTVFTGKDGVDLSGVEIMATAFANLLRDQALRQSQLGAVSVSASSRSVSTSTARSRSRSSSC